MTILVVSDTHGAKGRLRTLLETRKDIDAFIFLGDGLGSVNTVMEDYPDIPFYAVRGNCDTTLIPSETLGFIELAGKKILFTHGHLYGAKYSTEMLIDKAKNMGADIVLFGHTHERYENYTDGIYIMNPGSLERPRHGDASYGIIEITKAGIMTNTVLWNL